MDNEQVENVVFSIRYSLQQLEERLTQQKSSQDEIYFDIIARVDNNMKVLLTTMQGLQQDVLQMRIALGEIKASNSQPVLSPRTPVVTSHEEAHLVREKTSQADIQWDRRASDIAPEESFGFKIPNKK